METERAITVYRFEQKRKGRELDGSHTDDTVIMESKGDQILSNLIANFEVFLKACGFVFDGNLGIVNEDD